MKRRRAALRPLTLRVDHATATVLSAEQRGETRTDDAEAWEALIHRLAVDVELFDVI